MSTPLSAIPTLPTMGIGQIVSHQTDPDQALEILDLQWSTRGQSWMAVVWDVTTAVLRTYPTETLVVVSPAPQRLSLLSDVPPGQSYVCAPEPTVVMLRLPMGTHDDQDGLVTGVVTRSGQVDRPVGTLTAHDLRTVMGWVTPEGAPWPAL